MTPEESKKCPKCGGEIIGIEYGYGDPYRYDGISEWACQKCDWRIGRWSGKALTGKEQEAPYGEDKYITPQSKHYNL